MLMLPSGLIRLNFSAQFVSENILFIYHLSAILFEKKIFKNYTRDAKQGMISYDNSRKICLGVLLRKED